MPLGCDVYARDGEAARPSPGQTASAQSARSRMREAEKRLVAYFTVKGEAVPDAQELRLHLKESLPEYMVPTAYVLLGSLPLTSSGKVDRRALPDPEAVTPEAQYVAPATPTEEVLAQIWAEVLQVDQVGAEDNFFELGGHSLLGTRVMARVREQFEVELPLRVLFDTAGNVRRLAAQIEAARRRQQGLQLPPLREPRGVRRRAAAVVHAGAAVVSGAVGVAGWRLQHLQGVAFCGYGRCRGSRKAPPLSLVKRHESLRTRFRVARRTPLSSSSTQLEKFRPERREMPGVDRGAPGRRSSGWPRKWRGRSICCAACSAH